MHALLHSVFPTLQQATADLHLHRRLLDTHGQVWVSHLWGHCSFLLGPGVHKVLFMPSKSLFPQSYVSSGSSVVGLMARAFPRGSNTPDQDVLGNLVCPLQSTWEPKSPQDEWRACLPPSLCPLPEAEPGCIYSAGCNGLHRSVTKRSYPSPKFGRRLREATPCPRSGAAAERSYPTPAVRGGGGEEIGRAHV